MENLRHRLYLFVGLQSCLIGIFPFYIPVFLFKAQGSIAQICSFIFATGIGFVVSLFIWDRLSKRISLKWLMILSLISEWLLVTCFFFSPGLLLILLAGSINGLFNCSFWITQRLIFMGMVTKENSGERYGNFQSIVFLLLKAGIFIGGAVLERSGLFHVFLVTAMIIMAGSLYILLQGKSWTLPEKVVESPPMRLHKPFGFTDRLNSRPIFAVDGIFLYLESYFWMISLFILVKQNFQQLGILVIFLAVLFSLLFIIIKNYIDRLPGNTIYRWAVLLYGISWILRGMMPEQTTPAFMYSFLAIITFCTSIFRLAFNKRFFDIANSTTGHEYIYIKSYISQFFLALSAAAGIVLLRGEHALSILYFTAAPLSLTYLVYQGLPVRKPLPERPRV